MDQAIKELIKTGLLEGKSVSSIAKDTGEKVVNVRSAIKAMGLDWLIVSNRKLSKGHAALLELFQELLPNYTITTEHNLGNRLFLDIYCAQLNIGAEFHGRQHFEYVPHFHSSKADFLHGQQKDQDKINKCKELGIGLVVFCYNEDLSLDAVTARILEAIGDSEPNKVEKKQTSLSSNSDYYQKMKRLSNERKREQYKRMKQGKKSD